MKITKQFKQSNAPIYESLPTHLWSQFKDKSINECIKEGLITDLGDDKGQFFLNHADSDIEASYGIINGYAVRLSEGLVDSVDSIDDEMVGRLRFTSEISTIDGPGFGKPYFRLGMPRGLRLGDTIYELKGEEAEA